MDFFVPSYTNQQFSNGQRTLKDEKILLEVKIPKSEIEIKTSKDNFKTDEEKVKKFYKPADDFWQKLFPFDVFTNKTQAGKCGKFVSTLGENGNLEVQFDGLKIENSYQNLQCVT